METKLKISETKINELNITLKDSQNYTQLLLDNKLRPDDLWSDYKRKSIFSFF